MVNVFSLICREAFGYCLVAKEAIGEFGEDLSSALDNACASAFGVEKFNKKVCFLFLERHSFKFKFNECLQYFRVD